MNEAERPGADTLRDGRRELTAVPGEERYELSSADVSRVLTLYVQERAAHQRADAWWLDLGTIGRAARRGWWVLAVCLLAGLATTYALLTQVTPIYRISSQVLIGRDDVATSAAATPSLLGAGSAAFIATQAELLQSRSLLADAVARVPLTDPQALRQAQESVQASPVSGTQIVELTYLGPNPTQGTELLSALIEAYRSVLRQSEQVSQQRRAQAKSTEIDILEAEARKLESELAAERTANGVVGSAAQTVQTITRSLQTQTERLAQVRERRIALESTLVTGGASRAVDDPAVEAISDRLVSMRGELARLQRTLTDQHPTVAAAQREVAALEEQLAASELASPRALEQDIAANRRIERALEALIAEDRQRLATVESFAAREREALADLERLRLRIDAGGRALLDQQVATRLADDGAIGVTARVIEVPTAPDAPVWPRPALLYAIASTVALALGMLIALARDARATRSTGTADAHREPR